MSKHAYLNFDLAIERSGDRYRARVLASPGGSDAALAFALPFSDLELENLRLRVARPGGDARRHVLGAARDDDGQAVKRFGGRLYGAVFDDEVQACLRRSLDKARDARAGLRLRLRLTDAPELAELPWEYLFNPTLNRFLCLSDDTPLVRYLDLDEPVRPQRVVPPLRVLVAIASPADYPRLDVEREWARLNAALAELGETRVAVDWLADVSLAELQRQLRRNEYHIFHFIGHGHFDQTAQDGELLFEEKDGRARRVSGQHLAAILHNEETLRLAVINACEGARGSCTEPYAGTAQRLVQQGIPAVIAMQSEISDEAAITFATVFYEALADGYPVDAALAQARLAIFAQPNAVEWATPVLYLRAPDGQIFDIDRRSRTRPPPPPPEPTPPVVLEPPIGGEEPTTDAGHQPPADQPRPPRRARATPLVLVGVSLLVAAVAAVGWFSGLWPPSGGASLEATARPALAPLPGTAGGAFVSLDQSRIADDDPGLAFATQSADDRLVTEVAARRVSEANQVWATVVASDKAPLADLERVYGGTWLAAVRGDVAAMRARGQYRVARLLAPVVITSVRPLGAAGQRYEAQALERWDDRLYDRDGSPAREYPGQVAQRYVFELRDGRWLIVESQLVRG